MAMISITETPNSITENIDISNASEILDLLSRCDEQIFSGWEQWGGMSDPSFIDTFLRAHDILAGELRHALTSGERLKVIFSGAGTSGRIAMLLATEFNSRFLPFLGYPVFDFIIAGGNLALIKAQEGAEDDALEGMADLDLKISGCDRFILAGITCGFSANYISGQLYKTIISHKMPAFLIGFNPVERARTVSPENWPYSFAGVLDMVIPSGKLVVLNPVIGPEPVTGSTRMKGGTATKMIGDMLLTAALISLEQNGESRREHMSGLSGVQGAASVYHVLLDHYRRTIRGVYAQRDALSRMLVNAGEALRAHGHIYYVGEAAAGKLGIIDASECPPTFGADFHDVRGFIEGGWSRFCPSGKDLSGAGDLYNIALDYFFTAIKPVLTERDIVIVSGTSTFLHSCTDAIKASSPAVLMTCCRDWRSRCAPAGADLVLPVQGDTAELPLLTSIAYKLVYNAVTTAAHIFKGKVYKNKMIDLRISNNKLYHRSLSILQEITGASSETARTALLRSIYQTDTVTDEMRGQPVSRHIGSAADREKIIPVALVLAAGNVNYKTASGRVEQDNVIRNIINTMTG